MNKLTTAEDFLDKYVTKADSFYTEEHEKAMIEFTKFHREALIDAIRKKIMETSSWATENEEFEDINLDDCYPEENIK